MSVCPPIRGTSASYSPNPLTRYKSEIITNSNRKTYCWMICRFLDDVVNTTTISVCDYWTILRSVVGDYWMPPKRWPFEPLMRWYLELPNIDTGDTTSALESIQLDNLCDLQDLDYLMIEPLFVEWNHQITFVVHILHVFEWWMLREHYNPINSFLQECNQFLQRSWCSASAVFRSQSRECKVREAKDHTRENRWWTHKRCRIWLVQSKNESF